MPDLNDIQTNGFNVITVQLSAAQILALFTTPVQLLPPPGPGFFYMINRLILRFFPGGSQYAGGGNLLVVGNGGSILTTAALPAVITGAVKQICEVNVSYSNAGLPTANLDNAPVSLNNITAPFTGGNGTLSVSLQYNLEPST